MEIRYTKKDGSEIIASELKEFQRDYLEGTIAPEQIVEANGRQVTASDFAAMTATLETPSEQKNPIQDFIDHDLILKMEDSSRKAAGNAMLEFKGRRTKEERTTKDKTLHNVGCALMAVAFIATGLLSLCDVSVGICTGVIGFLFWYYVWDKEHKPRY